jgi:hypothetical protein
LLGGQLAELLLDRGIALRDLLERGGFEPSRPFISRSFCGLRAISILSRALASVRSPQKFCVGVRSPLLDDGPTVPGNAARFFGIQAYYLSGPDRPRMRRFSGPKTDAVVGEAEFIGWVAAYANEHQKPRGLVTGNSGSLRLAVRMPDDGVSTAKVSSLREAFS